MGWFDSSEENIEIIDNETKNIDATGHVNTNIIIQEARDTHHQVLIGEKLLIATYWLIGAELLKLTLYCFQTFRKVMKKKYQATVTRNA